MAKFYGRGTGANRGYWEFQWRDGKGRWIEMGAVGRYVIDGVSHTGRVIGGDSADSITVERRTANGQTVETTLDKINPKDIEMMDVKALLDIPEGFTEDEIAKARNSELTRPTPASYPNGTKVTTPDSEYTKTDQGTWSDSEGNTLSNDDITARLDDAEDSSAEIPEEAELTQENILNATDGSVLSWNSKNYSRIGGKWYDDKTGKPVSDRTMSNKTDGDLRTDGAEEAAPTPTPASEYETGTKLRAEKESGDDSADLTKDGDNAWTVETDSNTAETDDATTDKLIESADYLEDLSDFLQNPEESEPTRNDSVTIPQAEDRIAEIDAETGDPDELTDEKIADANAQLDTVDSDLDAMRGTPDNSDEDIDRLKAEVQSTRDYLENSRNSEPEEEPTPEPAQEEDTPSAPKAEEEPEPESATEDTPEPEVAPAEAEATPDLPAEDDEDQYWSELDSSDFEGVDDLEALEYEDGAVLHTYVDTASGKYTNSVYPAGSDTDISEGDLFDTRAEARENAETTNNEYDPVAANSPETFVEDDLTEGSLADPETVDESLSTPDVESVKQDTQEAAEQGNLTVEEVDESADFTPTPDIDQRRDNAAKLANPQDGDIITKASGRQEQYLGGMWTPIDNSESAPSVSNDAQKKLNSNGPQTFRMGDSEVPEDAPAPKRTTSNKHDVPLRPGKGEVPDFVQLTREDGHQETYKNVNGRWHRVLDNQGNVAPNHTSISELNDRLDNSVQVATKKNGGPTQRPVKAPEVTPQSSLTPGNTPVKDVVEPSKVLGDHVVDKNPKGAPNTVLSQESKTGKTQLTGMTDGDGNAYYVGDRVTFDHFGEARSGRVTAVVKKPAGYSFTIAPDEHDIRTPEGSMPFDEWNQLSIKDKKESGAPYGKLITVSQSKMENKNLAHAGESDTKETLSAKTEENKEKGRVTGNVITEPEILNDVSSDRVVRDESTRIIGTTNKYGELYQRGDVVTYGPNGERGTIVHVGEADDRIRIAPNGQSALESVYHHVDTLEHSNQPASYYDKNYDLPANERVANDRFNNPVSVGDTIYRYGLPFTVKDIYPDGSKIRVVGQDWAGEQGSSPAVQFSKLIDLGVDKETAKELSSSSEHDYMPDHIQVFTGDVNDIKSVRTHDSHMMTLTRDADGNVLDTPENRAAARSRAIGTKGSRKQTNSAVARYVAENGDSERYEGADLQPGDYIDQGIDQAASDNLNQYINNTFGSDLVLPDNSRMIGYNKFGQYETYTKKDNQWTIDGIEGGQTMTAEEFYQYRLNNGYIPNPDGDGDQKQSRLGLTYLGDADDHVVPKPGSSVKKSDDAKFALMPNGSVVKFTDAEGNEITIRKGPDGQWYKVTQSGAWSNNRKPIEVATVPGKATYRGLYNKEVPLPKSVDTTSREAKQQNVNRQKREVARNDVRIENGGTDRIYAKDTSGRSTYSGVVTEKRIAESEQRAKDAEEQNAILLKEIERLRKLAEGNSDEGDTAVSASALGNRVVATRKGTDHVVAVYNRVNGNVWEHTSGRGYRREFVMDAVPSTPGITYKVEENIA